MKVRKCWRFDHIFCWFWPYFYGVCAETPIFKLPATIVTMPLDSTTPILCNRRKFRQSESVYDCFAPFFFAHVQDRHYLCFLSRTCYHHRSQRHRFLPARRYASADLCDSDVSACLSVTCQYCAEQSESRIVKCTPSDSPMTLVCGKVWVVEKFARGQPKGTCQMRVG